MSSFGEQLSAARKAKGYTQTQFAEQLHVSRQAVSHWENDRAIPDLRTIQQIAALLGSPFTRTYEQPDAESAADAPSAAPAETASEDAAPIRRKRWPWLAALGACMALLCCMILWLTRPTPAAEIVVEPLEPVAYLVQSDEFGKGGVGWIVTFSMENVSDVPFTPDHVVAVYYEGERIEEKFKLTYDELLPYMDNPNLCREDSPLHLMFGSNHLNQTHMECVIYGTDGNGHELQFRGRVQFSQEFAATP